jgi:hypothetical protein
MTVYFGERPDGLIKIGYSGRAQHRVSVQRLKLLAFAPGGRKEEKEMHERFAAQRIGKSEIFRPEPELLDFIAALPATDPGITRVHLFIDNKLIEWMDSEYPEIGSRSGRVIFIVKSYLAHRRKRREGGE